MVDDEQVSLWKGRLSLFAKIRTKLTFSGGGDLKFGIVSHVSDSGVITLTNPRNHKKQKDIHIDEIADSSVEPYKEESDGQG